MVSKHYMHIQYTVLPTSHIYKWNKSYTKVFLWYLLTHIFLSVLISYIIIFLLCTKVQSGTVKNIHQIFKTDIKATKDIYLKYLKVS